MFNIGKLISNFFLLLVPKTLEEKGEIDSRSVYVGNVS